MERPSRTGCVASDRFGRCGLIESDLHESDDLRMLDFNGRRIFQLFRFDELGVPTLKEHV